MVKSQCGSQCFISTYGKNWFCVGELIEQSPTSMENRDAWPKDLNRISRHDYVLDTIDGSLTPFLLNLNGRSIPSWSGPADPAHPEIDYDLSHDAILSLPKKAMEKLAPPGATDYLPAKCYCGGVSLLIKRGNYTSPSATEFSVRSLPSDPTKHLTYLCACRSCRLSTGASLSPWTLVPPSSVFNANFPDRTVTFGYSTSEPDTNPGLTLKHNWSSADTCRSFCGICGATVSYWCAKRPLEVDLAVGLFRAEEGSLARRWLEWRWGRCSYEEECVDAEMLEAWKGCEELMVTDEKKS